MFPGDNKIELETGCLGSRRIFRLGKRRKTLLGRGSCSTTREEDYKLTSHIDEGSCDEEEEYQPIPKIEEQEAPLQILVHCMPWN